MQIAERYIVGAGISGLIFAHFNPEFKIITDKKGQMSQSGFSGFVFIHDHPETRYLLDSLGIDYEPQSVYINYIRQKRTKQFLSQSATQDEMKSIVSRKFQFPSSEKIFEEPYKLAEAKKGVLHTLKFDVKTLYSILFSKYKDRIIFDKVRQITDDHIVCADRKYKYSLLISTIPASIFWKLYKGDFPKPVTPFLSAPQFFTVHDFKPDWLSVDLPDPSINYNLSRESRISKVVLNNGLYFCEYFQSHPGCSRVEVARINRVFDNIPPPNILFFGRYAEWNPDLRIETIVANAADKFFMHKIWSDQKMFNTRYVDFSRINDLKYSQQWAKEYMLCLVSEFTEMLNEMNWKFHRPVKTKLTKKELLEEWIDIFKYWLSIGLLFGFTVDDMKQMYWDKSKVVEERFKGGIK